MRLTKEGQRKNYGKSELINTPLKHDVWSKLMSRGDVVGFRLSGKDGSSNYYYDFKFNRSDIHAFILAATNEYRDDREDDLSVVSGFVKLWCELSSDRESEPGAIAPKSIVTKMKASR